jgi:orotidine-5'-phosphate decarboxylase
MAQKNFADRVIKAIHDNMSYLCVGLDPQLRYFPPHILKYCAKKYGPGFRAAAEAIIMFNKGIIDATNEFAFGFKPQMAFYEKYGHEGVKAFEETVDYALLTGKIVIEDGKREDGDDTARAYADGHLGQVDIIGEDGTLVQVDNAYKVDALTITPWIEEPNFKPFLEVIAREGRGVFVVTRTSFKPTSSLQEMAGADGEKGWIKLAKKVRELGESVRGENGYSSVGVVMGATYPEDASIMKEILPDAFKLIPGFGIQKGTADDAVVCVNDDGFGIIPNNSRGTNYAYHPRFKMEFQCDPRSYSLAAAKASQQARDALNAAVLKRIGKLPW